MNFDLIKVAIILGLPIIVPPVGFYLYNIPPTYLLGAIIALYLPIWWTLRKDDDRPEA